MGEKTLSRYFDAKEDLIGYMLSVGARREDLLESLAHEREHARKAHELGYKSIKWGYRAIAYFGENTTEDAIKVAEATTKPSGLDEKLIEEAKICAALDEVGYPVSRKEGRRV